MFVVVDIAEESEEDIEVIEDPVMIVVVKYTLLVGCFPIISR